MQKKGFTIFFTGFSGSGKSTLAETLKIYLEDTAQRTVTLLDGNVVRCYLSKELGFSKKDRDVNIRRIGFVASEITKHGGVAICSVIAPYTQSRRAVRDEVSKNGRFIEVHVSTPIETCEKRDVRGLYAKVRNGEIKGLTGIDDPYEVPDSAEVVVDTRELTIEESVNYILDCLHKHNLLNKTQ